jgi:hypothetical protein
MSTVQRRMLFSSPLLIAKGDPVLGISISGLAHHILAFSTPENAPTAH